MILKNPISALSGMFRRAGIPEDKGLHFVGGAVIALVLGILAGPLTGLAAAALIGALKEWRDSTGRGHVEFLDFLATAGGGALAFAGLIFWPSLLSFFL